MIKVLRQAIRKIRLILQRAQVRRVSYSGKIRYLQLQPEGGQPIDDIEHLEQFGFTSHPLPGAEAIALAFNGNGSHTVALLVGDQRYRLVIEEGETAIYNHHGDKVHIKKDRSISVEAALKVELKTPLVNCTGDLTAAGKITGQTVTNAAGVILGSHDHDETGSTTLGPNV